MKAFSVLDSLIPSIEIRGFTRLFYYLAEIY